VVNWNDIKEEYLSSRVSLRSLSKKYEVSYSALQRVARQEDCQSLRRRKEAVHSDLKCSIDDISCRLLKAIDRAVGELDSCRVVTKTKVKTQDGEQSTEHISFSPGGNVDCKDLKVLTAALKDIRDIQMIRSPLDIREQEAKIRNLERQLSTDSGVHVTVTLNEELENFAR